MKDPENGGHEQGIESPGHDGTEVGRIPYPPGSQYIPEEKSRVGVEKNTSFSELVLVIKNVIFDEKKGDKTDEKKR